MAADSQTPSRPAVSASAILLALSLGTAPAMAQPPLPNTPGTTTVDLPFVSHDGYPMRGRLTLPTTPGRHPVLMLVQTAEATILDGTVRNVQGERVAFHNLYRDHLTPLGIGFFSYEGRGVTTGASGREIEEKIYFTSTLDNKVRDGITALRLLQQQPGVDPSQIFLRGISEGTQLAADIAARIPREVKGLVLSGLVASTLKEALKFMAADGYYLHHLEFWDTNGDHRITPQEFDADPKGIRKQLPAGFSLSMWDTNADGVYTREEALARMQPLVAAIDANNFDVIQPWLQASSATPVPEMRSWLKDHFSYPTMWSFLLQLTMPIGVFQGEIDANTPAADVRTLEQQARSAGKTNIEFRYFDGLEHGLGSGEYSTRGKPSAGYEAIFDFMRRHTR